MNKSIYKEAKRDLISLTAKFVIPSVEETEYGCLYDSCHFYNTLDEQEESYLKTVEQALEQAQKQEKLLNKIKEIIDRQDDSYIRSLLEESNRYCEIEKLIEELENEQ